MRETGVKARAMKALPLIVALALPALAGAAAAERPGIIWDPPPRHDRGFGGFAAPIWYGDHETLVIEKEVVREVPVAAPAPAVPPPPRKPYRLGASYDSLPGPCLKLIDEGQSYFHCGGEWYREVRSGNAALYKAVSPRL